MPPPPASPLRLLRLAGALLSATPGLVRAEVPPPVSASADYRIKPRDLLQFQMFSEPDLLSAQRVSSNGELHLSLIGAVRVAGFSLRQAERLLEQKYRAGGFFIDPQVTLIVQQYDQGFVSILGQVKSPQRVTFPIEADRLGILQAIAEAGGFTRVGRTDAVQVIRARTDGGEERITVNTDEFLRARAAEAAEFQLQSGDIVFVPERAI